VFVCQDGVQYDAPAVFDRLIDKKEIPVLIGVFVAPGRVKATSDQALDRFNRSFEYDSLGDAYVRFLVEELLPDVEKKTTTDGRKINLSHDGNDRAIAGASSGAIAAFTAAWERPEAFSRVFSAIGTYVGLRGGEIYPTLIRKFEPKPIRIYLQDGSHDINNFGGDWWMANQTMERALTFAGYEVNHVWGEGGHDTKQATEVFSDAITWLWKGWPSPVKKGAGSQHLQEILIPGEEWELVGEGYKFTEGPAANAKGEVYFNDVSDSKSYRIDSNGKPVVFLADSKEANGQAFGPDGRLYQAATKTKQIIAYDAEGHGTVVADGFTGNDIVVRPDGSMFVTNPLGLPGPGPSKVYFIKPNGEKMVVDSGQKYANGVTLSPDQSLLYIDDSQSPWVNSYVVQPNGTLALKQHYFRLYEADSEDTVADGIRVDRDGRLYVTTRMGIQVCDPAGRVTCIIPSPNRKLTNLAFGGPNFDILYATCIDKVYRREVKVHGVNAFQAPIKPAAPKL
jgi:sugar lactone lactonase YvrE